MMEQVQAALPHLFDDVALERGLKSLTILRQHGRPALRLHLEGTHLGCILPHDWVVALHHDSCRGSAACFQMASLS